LSVTVEHNGSYLRVTPVNGRGVEIEMQAREDRAHGFCMAPDTEHGTGRTSVVVQPTHALLWGAAIQGIALGTPLGSMTRPVDDDAGAMPPMGTELTAGPAFPEGGEKHDGVMLRVMPKRSASGKPRSLYLPLADALTIGRALSSAAERVVAAEIPGADPGACP
jgi:hypothetical protein